MSTVGTLIVRLNAVTSQFRKEMKEVREKLEQTAESAHGASTAIATTLAVVGTAATVAGGAAIKMAAQWEHTEIAFASMLKSGEKSQEFLAGLADFVAHTPFEMPGVIESSRRLLAFGFQAEEIIPVMTSVGNAVAAMGGGAFEIDRVTRALGQMRAKGRVTSQEMSLQLTEAGIPAWEYLAEAIGTTVPDAMAKVEQRLIPATVGVQAILAGMSRDFGGSMDVMSKTTIGLWSTVMDHMRVVSIGLGSYLMDALNVRPMLADMAKAFGVLSREIMSAKDKAQAMRNILHRIFTPEVQTAAVLLAGAVAGAVAPAFVLAAKAIWGAVLALGPFMLIGAAVALVAHTIYRAWADAGGGIAAVSVFMVRMIASVVNVLGLLAPPFRGVAKQMFAYADSIAMASRQANDLGNYADSMTRQQRDVAKSGSSAAKAQEELGKSTEEAAKRAGSNIMAFDQVHQLQESMAKATAPAIQMPSVAAAGVKIPDLKAPAVAEAIGPLNKAAEAMQQVSVATDRANGAFTAMGYAIAGAVVAKSGIMKSKLALLSAETLKTAAIVTVAWAKKSAAAVVSTASQMASKAVLIGKWASLGIAAITNATKVAGGWLSQKASALISLAAQVPAFIALAGKWVLLGIQAGVSAGKAVVAWAIMQASAVASVAAQAVQFAIMGAKWLWLGAQSMVAAGKMAVAWVVALGPVGWVIATVTALAILVIAKWDAVRAMTVQIWGGVSSFLTTTWGAIRATAGSVWSAMTSTMQGATTSATTWLATAWASAQRTLETTWGAIRTAAGSIWAKTADLIRGAINGIIAAINSFVRGFNRIRISVPAVTIPLVGRVGGFSIGMPQIPEIPMLAKGTNFVPQDTLAFLHRGESVVPKKYAPHGTDAEAIADAVGNAVLMAMREALRERQGGKEQNITLEIDGHRIGRAVLPYLRGEGQRTGAVIVT